MGGPLPELRRRLAEVKDLELVTMTLVWDQQTMMPAAGGAARADQLGTLERLHHERSTAPEVGRLIEDLAGELDGLDPEGDDAALIRVARRDFEKAARVPGELKVELARAGSIGQEAWVQARAESDWSRFEPHLGRMLELKRAYVDCFSDRIECAYDALLDDFEPGARTREVAAVFDELKAGLVPLIARISEYPDAVDAGPLHGAYARHAQRMLVEGVLAPLGFSESAWRLDEAAHPFSARCGVGDNRITTFFDEAFLGMSLYSSLHECGHSLYEDGVAPELVRTPLGSGVSLGLHESQSRLWENLVGRGRPFCRWLLPRLAAAFPIPFERMDAEGLYRAVNEVRPSLVRVKADEATYSLHVILRFELEQELIEGRLAPRDAPEAWNAKVQEYLGLAVPDDAQGVLQDVHWAAGLIGYFPTYALGNIMAAQIWSRMSAELPDLDARIEAGELGGLREWLRGHLHRYGRKFTPKETLVRAAGAPLDVGPYLAYLNTKFGEIYGV
jgi:carboxypeptidase Taq